MQKKKSSGDAQVLTGVTAIEHLLRSAEPAVHGSRAQACVCAWCVCTYIYMCVYMCVYVCICVYIHIYTYTCVNGVAMAAQESRV
jgi:type IV secretory pathway VirB3-like protein